VMGYPFLSNPVVRIHDYALQSNVVAVEYVNGIYSNMVVAAISNDLSAAYFRLWSPDNDPKHALIKVSTDRLDGTWTNLIEE
jgi:hypothetical protein